MANELSVLIRLVGSKGNWRQDINPGVTLFDMASGKGGTPGVLAATTTSAAISFGAVTPGYVWIRNLSTANTVKLTTTSNLEFAEFTAGKQALIPKGSGGWKLAASTAGGTADVDVRSFST